jgi:hypothetical protein
LRNLGPCPESNLSDAIYIQFLSESSEKTLKKVLLIAALFVFCLTESIAHGQQFDAAFGLGTVTSGAPTTSNGFFFPSLRGGAYPSISADFLITHRAGIEGEFAWRASQAQYGGVQPYRPIFYAINAIWAPRLAKPVTAELLAGLGGEDLRFYGIVNYNPLAGYTNDTSSNHFMGDFGGGIRAYFWHNAFIRPEARIYLIHNNVEFSSGFVTRYGVSLGYSFGGR